ASGCGVGAVTPGRAFGPPAPSHNSQVTQLAFTSDGRLLSSGDDSTIRAWDPNTGKELSRLQAGAAVWQFAASPDGSLMASSSFDPGTVHVWDTKSNKEVFKLTWSLSRT